MEQVLKTLNKEGYIIHPIKGESMLPLLHQKKDLVKIIKYNQELKVGDVILYNASNCDHFVLHRVIKINKKFCLTRGDNCYTVEKVYKNRIVGLMVGIYKNNQYISIDNQTYKAYVDKVLKRGKPFILEEYKLLFDLCFSSYEKNIINKKYPQISELKLFYLAKRLKLTSRVNLALKQNSKIISPNFTNKFFSNSFNFRNNREEIVKVFNEIRNNKIEFIDLSKDDDFTIFVEKKHKKNIVKIMNFLTYKVKKTSANHYTFIASWDKNCLISFIFHFSNKNKQIEDYLNGLFKTCKKIDNYHHILNKDDMYIYRLICYKNNIDIKTFFYIYYFNLLDFAKSSYIIETLDKLNLKTYHEKIVYEINSIRNYNYENEDLIFKLVKFTNDDLIINNLNIKKSLFPSFKVMKSYYPSLKYTFILLPFYYLFRILKLSLRKDNFKKIYIKFKSRKKN